MCRTVLKRLNSNKGTKYEIGIKKSKAILGGATAATGRKFIVAYRTLAAVTPNVTIDLLKDAYFWLKREDLVRQRDPGFYVLIRRCH
jgi:hypothetical protein